ncbi:MAG TPA: lipoprotein [Sphingopyxis sp.]|nr:lipoprotein [Sphingopyxis sp.]
MAKFQRVVSGAILGSALLLAACGQKADLKPPAGEAPQAVPIGATRVPTTEELTTPSVQARPARSDELLKRSEERAPDDFDLPPQR